MNPIKYIKHLLSVPRILRENKLLKAENKATIAGLSKLHEMRRWAEIRETEAMGRVDMLKKELDKKQQEHDLTFHQLHMLRASVEAHINRAKVQEAIILEQAEHIDFLKSL